ncbi:MAG: HTH domain-containing protein [Parcubacteria group bacterium]|nr:HTH domain-containing protein [Parcubacteria group bacterium]MCR4342644.1 HTH domain-containing protein [Patescibacteria group bacterium]
MQILQFKPKQITKKMLSVLKDRSRDIIEQRYGLGLQDDNRKTLEAIGQQYGITRERVRQIENFSLNSIRKSNAFAENESVFANISKEIERRGKVVHEEEFLNSLAKDDISRNHLHFLLVVSPNFTKFKEDDDFHHRWTVNIDDTNKIHEALKALHQEIKADDIISENEMIERLNKHISRFDFEDIPTETLYSWIKLSKLIGKNDLGEWGVVNSCNIRPRGVRDLAFLVLRRHGSPMHFTEVAKSISGTFGKIAHPQTTHNELIKDERFVLVGRGLYGLSDWGYSVGTVKDVIKNILKTHGSLAKEDIIKKVLKERYVKENTILVNLQDKKYFKKNSSDFYIAI